MPLKKSELYSSCWASCDELRGGMDASQYKDYVLVLPFVKYVSDSEQALEEMAEEHAGEEGMLAEAKNDKDKLTKASVAARYGKLTEDEIKTLVVDDQWLAALAAVVQGELDRVSQTLTGRVRQSLAQCPGVLDADATAVAQRHRQRVPALHPDGRELHLHAAAAVVAVAREEVLVRDVVPDHLNGVGHRGCASADQCHLICYQRLPQRGGPDDALEVARANATSEPSC
jgi:hypothetical protein